MSNKLILWLNSILGLLVHFWVSRSTRLLLNDVNSSLVSFEIIYWHWVRIEFSVILKVCLVGRALIIFRQFVSDVYIEVQEFLSIVIKPFSHLVSAFVKTLRCKIGYRSLLAKIPGWGLRSIAKCWCASRFDFDGVRLLVCSMWDESTYSHVAHLIFSATQCFREKKHCFGRRKNPNHLMCIAVGQRLFWSIAKLTLYKMTGSFMMLFKIIHWQVIKCLLLFFTKWSWSIVVRTTASTSKAQ